MEVTGDSDGFKSIPGENNIIDRKFGLILLFSSLKSS
jgi:hypothetical protein